MKKILSTITLIFLMSLVVACGYQEKISAPKSDKIILTLASEDKSIKSPIQKLCNK